MAIERSHHEGGRLPREDEVGRDPWSGSMEGMDASVRERSSGTRLEEDSRLVG